MWSCWIARGHNPPHTGRNACATKNGVSLEHKQHIRASYFIKLLHKIANLETC